MDDRNSKACVDVQLGRKREPLDWAGPPNAAVALSVHPHRVQRHFLKEMLLMFFLFFGFFFFFSFLTFQLPLFGPGRLPSTERREPLIQRPMNGKSRGRGGGEEAAPKSGGQ